MKSVTTQTSVPVAQEGCGGEQGHYLKKGDRVGTGKNKRKQELMARKGFLVFCCFFF